MARAGRGRTAAATKVSASHLNVTTYATDQTVAPGTHFSLVLDVTPASHVHVYAPGVTGYKPIGLALKSQSGLLVRTAQFPRAEDFYFKPLDEHVLVYRKPFRIVQDVAIDASPEGVQALRGLEDLTIAGTLDYQACDDQVCFTPQSIPLTWTVKLKPLDRERFKKP
jgi:DsbC/DsbD-like thiol-disulfide interchange protein